MLGLILGAHPDGCFVGEPAKLMQRRRGVWRHRRYCARCRDFDGAECPVWTAETVQNLRAIPERFYEDSAHALGNPSFLVDGSKDLAWYSDRLSSWKGERYLIHLTKGVESYVASVVNRNPRRGRLEFIAADWARTNHEVRQFARDQKIPRLRVRYEDLTSDVERTLARIGNFVGFEPSDTQAAFWRGDPHYIKGNPGAATHFDKSRADAEPGVNPEIYTRHHRTIFQDAKWRQLLSPREIDRLYALPTARRESRHWGYSHPLGGSVPTLVRARAFAMEPPSQLGRSVWRLLRRSLPGSG